MYSTAPVAPVISYIVQTKQLFVLFCSLVFLDPYEDQFEKKIQAKKERVAKNEYQRLRNIAKNKKIPGEFGCILNCHELPS